MSPAWFIVFALLWTGFLTGAAILLTQGRISARFAQLVWRGAAFASLAPIPAWMIARTMPDTLPAALPDLPYVEPAAGAVTSASVSLQSAVSGLDWAWTAPALIAVLAAGWLFRAGAVLLGQVRLQALKSRSVPFHATLNAIPLTQIGIERVPELRLIEDGSPFIAGLSRRAVYIPRGLEAPNDLRQIVIHECVHLKRGDLVTRPLERLVADVFWFSPFAWLMRRELDFWREAVCDEIASAASGDRIGYARTLAHAARIGTPARSLPVAAFNLKGRRSLPLRLSRILENRPARSRPVMAVATMGLAMLATPFAIAEVKQDSAVPGEEADTVSYDVPVLQSSQARMTSGFGDRLHPVTGKPIHHNGVDIAAPAGTPVHTPSCGRVVYSGFKTGHGETVEIAYADGSRMRFAQLEDRLVKLGEEVGSGAVIGTVGMSGRYATGPHLHLERWTREDGDEAQPVDPMETADLVLFASG